MDLSITVQRSGLVGGAKLALVQSSRSAVPVSVALQLPHSDNPSSNVRLVDKFPSTTTLWQILRRFESGVAGGAATVEKNFNFTQRATPLMADGTSASTNGPSGAGRLCYAMPTLNIMGRQLDSIPDLSKSLQQYGVGGSVLVRLSFKNTMQPLEHAMEEISQYFGDIAEQPSIAEIENSIATHGQGTSKPVTDLNVPAHAHSVSAAPAQSSNTHTVGSSNSMEPPHHSPPSITNLSVFSAPTSSTPSAAISAVGHNDSDFIPTVEHARSHQANLSRQSRNKRLLTDAEVEKQRQERNTELAKVNHVTVRLRFPDQQAVQKTYGQLDTIASLYETCRIVMHRPLNESFSLHAAGTKIGGAVQGAGVGAVTPLPESGQKLITDLGWTGRILVTVSWGDNVPKDRRTQPSLKAEFAAQAEELRVQQPKENLMGPGRALGDDGQLLLPNDVAAPKLDKKQQKPGDTETKLKKLLGLKK